MLGGSIFGQQLPFQNSNQYLNNFLNYKKILIGLKTTKAQTAINKEQLDSLIAYHVSGNDSTPNYKESFVYSSQGDLLSSITSNSFKGSWLNDTKRTFIYDASHRVLENVFSLWDTLSNQWNKHSKTQITYNANSYNKVDLNWNSNTRYSYNDFSLEWAMGTRFPSPLHL